jgi:hypothetical protein
LRWHIQPSLDKTTLPLCPKPTRVLLLYPHVRSLKRPQTEAAAERDALLDKAFKGELI